MANKGFPQALEEDVHLRNGINVHDGKVTCRAVAGAVGVDCRSPGVSSGLAVNLIGQIRPGPATPGRYALAYNLGNFLRTLATHEPIKNWSLTSLKEKLIKIGAKVVSHAKLRTCACSKLQKVEKV